MDSNFGDAVASSLQPRDRLKDRGSENNEMPRRVWEAMETRTEEVWLAEAKGGRDKRGSREKTKRAGNEEEKGEENSRGKKYSLWRKKMERKGWSRTIGI